MTKATKRSAAAKKRNDTARPAATETKRDKLLALLRRKNGATIADMTAATGWQPHSVRGFLSGTVKKKLGLTLDSKESKDGARRYFAR